MGLPSVSLPFSPVLVRLLTKAGDVFLSIDAEGLIGAAAGACEQLLYSSASGLTGKAFLDTIHPEDVPCCTPVFERALEGKAAGRLAARHRGPAGAVSNINWFFELDTESGCVYAIGRNATGWLVSGQKVSEASLRRVKSLASIGTWVWRYPSGNLEVSGEVFHILGVKPEERHRHEGRLPAFVHPDDLKATLSAHARAVEERAPLDVEYRMIRKDSTVRRLHEHGEPSRDAVTGEPVFFGVIQDITERWEAQKEIEASERRYRLYFDSNPLPLWVHEGESLHFLAVNQAAADLFGYSREQFLEMRVNDLFRQARSTPEAAAKLPSAHDLKDEVWHLRKSTGEDLWVATTSSAIEIDGRPARLVASVDVTERLRLEEQLRQSQKMDAVGQLAAGVAHDFNNLLTVINGYVNLLLDEPEVMHLASWELREMQKAGSRAVAMTQRLLAFSRRQVLTSENVDLNEVVAHIRTMLQRLIPSDIGIVNKLHEEPVIVRADPVQIEQVLLNLVLNARDAMPKGGRITIHTGKVEISAEYFLKRRNLTAGLYAVLEVSDNGAGMTSAVKSRIFEPFFTTKEQGRGTGLGLSIVYGIVTQSGGHIECESDLGVGTKMQIFLPMSDAVAHTPAAPDEKVEGGSETILVIEDNDEVREFVVRVLSRAGYRVFSAANGEEGIEFAARARPEPDLVVADLALPGMNGRVMVDALRQRQRRLAVLFISGFANEAEVYQTLEEVGELLRKPFTPADLLRCVRIVLSQRKDCD